MWSSIELIGFKNKLEETDVFSSSIVLASPLEFSRISELWPSKIGLQRANILYTNGD
jgi:hypothetical protein